MPKPGNEGLINRVLGLISGETKQKEREEHQRALVEAMQQGAQQALRGIVSMGMQAQQADPTAQIRGLLGGAGPTGMEGMAEQPMPQQPMPQQPMPQMGMARGGYPDLYGLDVPVGVPEREPFSTGGKRNYVPSDGMSGRSDKVQAMLSPNEYVIDSESVSMLGDGSPDAGAQKLDKFRANIRKHKGKALAKGKFSPNAREPESYLK